MELHCVKATVRQFSLFIISLVCGLAFSASSAAQTVGDPAKARMQEMDRRELQLNRTGREEGQPNDPKRTQAMMAQVNEDFQRILTLHNQIVRAIDLNQPFDLQFISEAAGEIRKRSARLQTSLQLPKLEEPTEGTRFDPKDMEIKDQLILLCKQIENFIRNPIIDIPGTVNAQQLRKARSDLQGVLEVSETIKKRVDKQQH